MWLLDYFRKKEPTVNDNISKIQSQIEILDKRERLLNKNIDTEVSKAKEAVKQNKKQMAMNHLKNKSNYEDQLKKIQSQRVNLETMIMKLEEATLNVETLKVQQTVSSTLKNVYKDYSIDDINQKMDDLKDTLDDAKEISEAISRPLDDPIEIEDELTQLENEIMDEVKVQPKKLEEFVPQKLEEEEELKKLEQALAN